MATDTVVTDQQYVKQEKDEAIAEKINSLANEDEDKHDKPEDAQDQTTPQPKTEGDELKAELAAVEIEKTDDSPEAAEDSQKNDNVDDAQSPIEKEGDDEKVEPAVEVEKTNDSVPLEAVVADDLKEEKELIPDSQTISVTELVEETPQNLETESIETVEEKKPKTADVPEAETTENSVETTEKEEKIDPEPVATEVQVKTEEPEKEYEEKSEEADQSSTVAISELSAEAGEKHSDATVEKTTTVILKETNNNEVEPTETGKAEPVVTEVETTEAGKAEPVVSEVETTKTEKAEPVVTEVKTTETAKEEPVVTEVETTDTGKAEPVVTEVETTETAKEEPVVTEVETTERVIAEPAVIEVEANQKDSEKQSAEQKEEEQPDTLVIPEHSQETSDVVAVEEKTREPETEAEVLKETNNNELRVTETEKAEPVVAEADEIQSEPEKQSLKQEEEEEPKTITPETEAEVQKKPGGTVEVHPPKDSDIEEVKETGNSESESIIVKEEKPELVSTEVDEKQGEEIQVGEKVRETSEDVKNKQETDKTEEKIDKEEETNTIVNTAQVSLNEESQSTPANSVEPSPEVEKKVVQEDSHKESSFTDLIESESSKEVAGVAENLEQASVDQEAIAVQKEEREHGVPTGVEEKTDVAANDDKKEPEAAVQVSSRDVKADEIKNTEAQNEAKTATTEAEYVQVKGLENDIPADDNKKEGGTETKVGEISKAVSEPVRETLASKFEEKEEESIETGVDKQSEEPVKTEVEATEENGATKTSKDLPKETPAKPAQKQSNNIIAKVKQSLVKAKKAITGKSPSSKNLSSDAKGDIKVK